MSLRMLQSLSYNLKWVPHNTQPNNFEYSHKVHFSKSILGKISAIFTNLPNEKIKSGSSV